MAEPSVRRRLPPGLYEVAIAGVALLRMHAARDPSGAAEIAAGMRRLLAGADPLGGPASSPLLDVVPGYDRWAKVYDLPGNPLVEREEPVVRPLLDALTGDPILDAACGTGRHLAYLAGRGHSVIGTDISPGMLDKAREKVRDADLRLGDLTKLPVADGEVGAVTCTLALDHIGDLRAAYREFARVMRPGGTLIVSTMHPVLRAIFGWGAWFIDEEGNKIDVPCYEHTIGDHLNVGIDAGLTPTRCEEPTVPEAQLAALEARLGARTAYEGIPMVLVLAFERAM